MVRYVANHGHSNRFNEIIPFSNLEWWLLVVMLYYSTFAYIARYFLYVILHIYKFAIVSTIKLRSYSTSLFLKISKITFLNLAEGIA